MAVTVGCTALAVLANRRIKKLGAPAGLVLSSTELGVPMGLVGGRAYHVATTWDRYSKDGKIDMVAMARLSSGGLGSWGALAGAALGTWIVCRRQGVRMSVFLDSFAWFMVLPVVAIRLGNWSNQEIFGYPTSRRWGVRIDPPHRGREFQNHELFHPIFVYEILGAVAITPVVVAAERYGEFGHGRVFATWLGLYSVLRLGLEFARSDPAPKIRGLRVNVWTAGLTTFASAGYVGVVGRLRPGRNVSAMRNSST